MSESERPNNILLSLQYVDPETNETLHGDLFVKDGAFHFEGNAERSA